MSFDDTLIKNFNIVLHDLEFDENLFQNLLCSMPGRLRQVREASGGQTDYSCLDNQVERYDFFIF